jgi:hypothetical protein
MEKDFDKLNYTDKLLTVLVNDVTRVENKIDKLNEIVITKEMCQKNQDNCNKKLQIKKFELTPARLTGYAGIITVFFSGILGILKLFFG